jgi:hypothetical protein
MKKTAINLVVFLQIALMLVTGCSSTDRRIIFKSAKEPDIVAADIAFPAKGDFWYIRDGRPIEMQSQTGSFEASVSEGFKRAFLSSSTDKFILSVPNATAPLEFNTDIPPFYTRINPKEMGIVRFTVQTEENNRYVLVTSPVGANVGFFYPESDEIPFSYAKMPNGIYRINITKPLSPGEYGIIVRGGVTTRYTVYSFTISGLH